MFAKPPLRTLFGVLPIYSVLIVTGIVAALIIASREERRLQLPKDTTIDLALWAVPFGVIGARLYYVAFAWDMFRDDLLSILYVWEGGIAIYGAILGGLLAVFLFSRRRKLPFPRLTDIIVPGLALAQAIGRWGNYFNMEAYGAEVTDPALQFFPMAVLIPGPAGDTWHMATFFYESIWNLMVFAALMLTRRSMRRDGDATLWYLLLYGAGRLIVEGLRTDSLWAGSSVRISQLLGVVMSLGVIAVFLARRLRRAEAPLPVIVLVAALLGGLWTALAGGGEEAFWGYRVSSVVLTALAAGCAASVTADLRYAPRARVLAVLCALPALLTPVVQRLLPGGMEAATLRCIAFTLAIIPCAVSVYLPAHQPAQAAQKL